MKVRSFTYRYALIIFIAFVAFFFILKLLGWEKITELRLLNLVIAAYFSNKLAKKNISILKKEYLDNFASILFSNLIAVFLCAISLFLYVTWWNTSLIYSIGNGFFLGKDLSLAEVCIAITIEGAASSIIIALIVMQYWKNVKYSRRKKYHI